MKTKIYISLLFLCLLSFASEVNGQARLIMLDNQRSQVRSSNLDFTNLDTLVSVGVVQPDGACVSLGLGKVFWVEGGGKQPLKVANLDGTNVQILDTFNTLGKQIMPRGIAINEYEGKLYVIGMGGYAICNLDGSNMNVVLSSLIRGRQIAINPNLGKMYFTDQSSRVFYANLDGTNRDTILKSGGSSTWGVRTDLVNNKLYFSDNRGVYRSNFNGSQRDTVFRTNVGLYLAIDIDPINNRFSYANNSGLRKRIYKGTLNPLVLTDSASHDGNIFDLTVGTLSNRQATNINFSNIGASSVTARWTKGNGTSRVAFLKADTAGWPVPLDGISYTANTTFGSGTQIGSSGWFCVYNGTDSIVNISGLSANTRYRLMVCEYSGTGANISYNRAPAILNPRNFMAVSAPSNIAPTVSTAKPSLIGITNATLGGNVSDSGTATVTERGIVYATTANPTTANTKVAIGSGMGNFSQNITGLTAATTYHVRAYAINSVGTSYGGDSTFTTLPIPPSFAPTVRTSSAFNVTATSALLGGSVLDSGTSSIIERGVVFSTSPNPTLANSKRIFPNPSVVALSVTGLTPSTLYHVRFYATNSTGTGYGGDSTFTTLPIPTAAPKVSTAQASLVGVTSATLGGNVSDSGTATVTERGIVYATTATPTTANTKVIIGSGIGSFSQNIMGLTAATTYHVRAYAINSVGTSYGGDSTFTTASVPVTSLTLSTSFDPFVTCEGIASSEQQFTVSGVNLSNDVTVNAPTGFEISLTLGGTYAASLNLTPVSGTLAITTLYIRLSSAATGVPAGNISAASTGAITQNQSINGTVNPAPAKPVINMQPASPICVGAKQLNFGAANEPPAGITYQWSTSSNASVYAQGSTKQYALISFPNAGSSKVILTASNGSCSASTELDVLVQTETTHEAIVSYFNNNFVCKANLVSAYQWGYDDKPVLKGNVIEGEINQNYFNASPDLTSKSYWVISTKGNCYQKTYYNAPSGLSNALAQSNAIKAFPNPFTHTITVTAEKGLQNYQISILDAQGKLLLQQLANSQSIELNLGNLSSGIYFIHVQDENGNISNIKMVKH
ncbi:MAG: T9SS type A sorting domain-containing protein [Bacteroidota bacterium]|nr:T9SS type A sorting domain-containing protein [Bacteroidota bacterium]